MATDSNGRQRKRRSIRLQGHDYSQAGAYFITVCTRDRECLFGNVVDGQMQLSEAGQVAQSVWDSIPQSYPALEIDAFVIMPNHLHGVIVIGEPIGAIHESPLHGGQITDRRRMLLTKIMGRFKMVSAKQINILQATQGKPVWQRNYFEHIVRDDESLYRIRQYIADNPAQWDFDCENPSVSASERRGDS